MQISDLTARIARADDMPALLDLQRRSFGALGGEAYGATIAQQILEHVTMLSPDLVDEGHYHVWEADDGRVIGSGGWSLGVPGYVTAMPGAHGEVALPEGTAMVRSVFVDPAFARRGIGRAIMRFIEADVMWHGFRRVTLTATMSGLPLYQAMGYRDDGPSEGLLPSGISVPLREMSLELPREGCWAA